MGGSLERSSIHVEGEDDQHALVHLLIQNGIDYDSKPWPDQFPEFNIIGNDIKLLEGMEIAIRTATNKSIGFVIDANSDIGRRWQDISDKLRSVDVLVPVTIPEDGFIGTSATYSATVGVWLMPDNRRDGGLEGFLESLIADDDFLINHAKEATEKAKAIGALFGDNDRSKAVIRAWLAWQSEPGHPYGRAIRKRYFLGEPPAKALFVNWFRSLFSIPMSKA